VTRHRVRHVEGAALVAVRVLVAGGERREAIPGQALLTGRMLTEGTRRRDFERVSADAEALGMILSSFGGYEGHGLAIDALAADWRQALEWAAELLFEPAFPEARLSWLARQAAAELEAQADEADAFTARAHLEQLWAPHPRARPLQGDAASLATLRSEDCREFHAAALATVPIVSVAGRVDVDEVKAVVDRLFGAGAISDSGGDARPQPAPPAEHPEARREIRTRAHDQAHLFLGHRTVARDHADYPALELAGVLLGSGSGLTGRVPQRIREREGLAYTASADAVSGASLDPGRLTVYIATRPATVAQAEASARDEVERFLTQPIGGEEFADAKAHLLGREPFRRETGRQWADLMASSELLGLPFDDPSWHAAKIAAVTAADVESAARRHLDPARLIATIGLPA
jgi:zinc protease